VGLFGYSRGVNGIKLPRAIKFTASMYSIGFPPEIVGLNALSRNDIAFLKDMYVNFERDKRDALRFINVNSPFVPYELKTKIKELFGDFEIDKTYEEITNCILRALSEKRTENLQEHIVRAASIRKFLG
jgi:phosphoenolpyruvate carboxylase